MTVTTAPPNRNALSVQASAYEAPAAAHIGRVRLAVSSLDRSIAFYGGVIGLELVSRAGRFAQLGVGGDVLLELEEQAGLQPLNGANRIGLYHTAFRLPSREHLSSFAAHLSHLKIQFAASDHLVSEAIYLSDPDGLEVEVYADRDRSLWPRENKEFVLATRPLRFNDLPPVSHESWRKAPAQTSIGHLHFYVRDLQEAAQFYHKALGLAVMTRRFPGALFMAAGGYHHHVGANVWAAGSPVASARDPRLLFWEFVLPDMAECQRTAASFAASGFKADPSNPASFTDASGIRLVLTSRSKE